MRVISVYASIYMNHMYIEFFLMQEYVKHSKVLNNEWYHRLNEFVPPSYSQKKITVFPWCFSSSDLDLSWFSNYISDRCYIHTDYSGGYESYCFLCPIGFSIPLNSSTMNTLKAKGNKNNFDIQMANHSRMHYSFACEISPFLH